MQLLAQKTPQEIGLIGHTVINYPDKETSAAIIDILIENNASLIELQIPFSDPVADGPVFMQANHAAIAQGTTVAHCYDFIATVSAQYTIPFVIMTYANIVLKQGFEQFIITAKAAGARGAIVPDLPLNIVPEYAALARQHNFAAISVVAPNITDQRLQTLSPYFDGFVYAMARAGVTGDKTQFNKTTIDYLNRLRRYADLPIAVGFGISSGEDLNFLRPYADYAVIGTQTLRAYQQNNLAGVASLWQELNLSCKA